MSLCLGAVFVALLVAAAAAVAFLFERGHVDTRVRHDLDQLQSQAELGADEVAGLLRRLGTDVRYLAGLALAQETGRARDGGVDPRSDAPSPLESQERLREIFLAFASARPDYLEIRLLGNSGRADELVGVQRQAPGLEPTPSTGYSAAVAGPEVPCPSARPPGAVQYSRFAIGGDRQGPDAPARVSLSASTPVSGHDGGGGGLLLVRMDLGHAFERAAALTQGRGTLVIGDEAREPLFQAGMDAESTQVARALARTGVQDPIAEPGAQDGGLDPVVDPGAERHVYLTERRWDPDCPAHCLTFTLARSGATAGSDALRLKSLLGVLALLVLTILLAGLLVRRHTRSLGALVGAADAIAQGDFRVELPVAGGGEEESLVRAFRHMAEEVQRREQDLATLNLELERRVKARTKELASEHRLHRLILDSVGDGVVVTDREGRFVLWNRKAEQIVGSGPERVPPERWSEHFGVFRDESGEPIAPHDLPLVRALRGESTGSTELYLCNPKGGEGHWAQVTARPLRDPEGMLTGAVAVLVDVTERRRLEAGAQAHRAELGRCGRLFLGAEVASTTAHQLSQPLGALCNYAGAALRLHEQGRLGESDLGEMLARIEQLAVEAGAILDRLRARIRRTEGLRTAVDVGAVVTSCLDFLGERIRREGVRLLYRPAAGLPPVVADPLELEHALIQLVVNALEAMEGGERGPRRLSVVTAHDVAAALVTIEIADTGPGVSAALADRLFHPWETDKPGALGIGLPIVQTVIESLGGRVRMESGVQEGTCFRIELPVIAGGGG